MKPHTCAMIAAAAFACDMQDAEAKRSYCRDVEAGGQDRPYAKSR